MPDIPQQAEQSRYLNNPINFMSELQLEFGRMDLNGDGVVTADEVAL